MYVHVLALLYDEIVDDVTLFKEEARHAHLTEHLNKERRTCSCERMKL